MKLDLRLRIGLFLFSKGNEIVEFGADQIEESKAFFLERYRVGKEFIDKLVADYDGSVFAMSDESLKIASLQAIAEDSDVEGRVADIVGHLGGEDFEFFNEIVKAAIEDPATLKGLVDSFEPGVVSAVSHIPDDLVKGQDVEASNVGWHMADQDEWKKIWEVSGAGEGVLVVTIDTGTRPDHPDIPDQAFGPLSVVPGEPSGIDNNGHGTHCQGTNTGQNGIGVAPKAAAGSIQCLSARGSGLSTWTAQAINLALDEASKLNMRLVLSISIGGGGPDASTTAALLRAKREGAIVCAAAGNSGFQGRPSTDWPANDINAASIAAYQRSGLIAGFSSGGPDVDVAFPGQDIVSANFRGGRVSMSGTSMATPGAAGYAAIQQSFRLRHGFALLADTAEFIEHCKEFATDAGSPGEDDRFGSGIMEIFEVQLKQKPDDVKGLAVDTKPKGGLATMIAIFLSLAFALCGSTNAQETVQLRTVVTKIERTASYLGDKLIAEPTDTVVSVVEDVKELPTVKFGSGDEATFIKVANGALPVTMKAIEPGVYVLQEPGEYMAFESRPVFERVTVEEPEPEFDLATIAPLAKDLATIIDDPATATALANEYEKQIGLIAGKELENAMLTVKTSVIENVFAKRKGVSQSKDWVNGFQRPMQAEFNRLVIDSTDKYRAALASVVLGLRETTKFFEPAAKVQPASQYQWQNTVIGNDRFGRPVVQPRQVLIK